MGSSWTSCQFFMASVSFCITSTAWPNLIFLVSLRKDNAVMHPSPFWEESVGHAQPLRYTLPTKPLFGLFVITLLEPPFSITSAAWVVWCLIVMSSFSFRQVHFLFPCRCHSQVMCVLLLVQVHLDNFIASCCRLFLDYGSVRACAPYLRIYNSGFSYYLCYCVLTGVYTSSIHSILRIPSFLLSLCFICYKGKKVF